MYIKLKNVYITKLNYMTQLQYIVIFSINWNDLNEWPGGLSDPETAC